MKTLFCRNEILAETDDEKAQCVTLMYDGWELQASFECDGDVCVYRQYHENDKAETVHHLLAKVYSDLRCLAPSAKPALAHEAVYKRRDWQALLRLCKLFAVAQIV